MFVFLCSDVVFRCCVPMVCSDVVFRWTNQVCFVVMFGWCVSLLCSDGVLRCCGPMVCFIVVFLWCVEMVRPRAHQSEWVHSSRVSVAPRLVMAWHLGLGLYCVMPCALQSVMMIALTLHLLYVMSHHPV